MSDAQLSPMNYINKVFGEACQDMGLNPQEVMNLLLFAFIQTPTGGRVRRLSQMRVLFNEFNEVADFDEVLTTINGAIEGAELKLYDWLLERSETFEAQVIDFAPKNQPESSPLDESVDPSKEV